MHADTPDSRRIARALADACLARLGDDVPLDRPLDPRELARLAGATVTPAGIGADEALRLWTDVLGPACVSIDHPSYLSFIPGAPTKAAASFDMLVGASSIYGGSWLEGSGAVYAENQALRWLADLAGLPAGAGGTFVQGGTVGNLSALVAARVTARSARLAAGSAIPRRWAVLVGAEVHSSVVNALESVMDVAVLAVPGDERGRLTGAGCRELASALPPDLLDGVFAIVATAGTTNVGVVDDLAGAADVAAEHGWWLHVDGAYGAAALAAPSARGMFGGIERADSLIVDPHKWLFAPFDCCALLYRRPELARAAHTQHAGYLDPLDLDAAAIDPAGEWNPSDYAVQLSRRARGLPFWFSLATHGTEAYSAAVEHGLATARECAELIRAAPHLELLVEPELSVLVFRRIGWAAADYRAWSAGLLDRQLAFVTPTTHRGEVCARFAIVNPRTTIEDLAAVLATMARPTV